MQRAVGSPPLVRERLYIVNTFLAIIGITPARAGKTIPLPLMSLCCQDHPRSCGKDKLPFGYVGIVWGSPPLVRERRTASCRPDNGSGITPARAGKTKFCRSASCRSQDHPRSCGKDHACPPSIAIMSGSPPLVRERH